MDELSKSRELVQCLAMGYSEEESIAALMKANNDVGVAIDILNGKNIGTIVQENDNEFDLIGLDKTLESSVPKPTVFKPYKANKIEKTNSVELLKEFLDHDDSRITSFTEMGFTVEQAITALEKCNNDMNEALTYLLQNQE